MSQRVSSIDIFRGFSMAMVINSHLFFGLGTNEGLLTRMFDDPVLLWFVFFASIGQLFFFVSGCSTAMSLEKDVGNNIDTASIIVKHARRGVIIMLIGMVFDPVIYCHFGHVDTLQIVGLASIVVPMVYLKIGKGVDGGKKVLAVGVLIVLLSPLARLVIGYPVIDPGAEFLVYYKAPEGIIEYVQAWFTTSFFPIFPYIAFFFMGAWFGNVITRKDKMAVRNAMKTIFKFGIFIFVAGLVLVVLPYLLNEVVFDLPQWEQEWWVIELSFNVQPMTTSTFILYTGFILTSVSFLYYVFDVEHSRVTNIKLGRMYGKLHVSRLFNTFVRYSHLSFTIYILQYLWIPTLRVIEACTGLKIMYSINDEMVLVIICVLSNIVFAFFARFMMEKPKRMRYTVENLVKVFTVN